jgi:hypothetical protein
MVSRWPRCLQKKLSEIEFSVKMRSFPNQTVRPYAPLLQIANGKARVLYRIGGKANLVLGIPLYARSWPHLVQKRNIFFVGHLLLGSFTGAVTS